LVRTEFNGRETFSADGGRALDFGKVVSVVRLTFELWSHLINQAVQRLGSFSSSELKSELHGFQIGQIIPFNGPNGQTIAIPNGFQLRTNQVDRERESYYLAGQWEDKSGDIRLTAKYQRIDNDTSSDERTLEFFGDGESFGQYDITGLTTSAFSSTGIAQCNGSNDPTPANPACEVTRPVSALYETGIISNSLRDWTGARGAPFTNLAIGQRDESMTDDLSLNLKWRPTDRLYVSVDAHRTTAEFDRIRLWGGTRFFSDFSNEGEMYALRGDVEYEFEGDGWFDSVQFGARYADREQTNRQAGLNWAGVAPAWAGGYLPWADVQQADGAAAPFDTVDFSGFFRGGVVTGDNSTVIFTGRDLLQDYDGYVRTLASNPLINARETGGTYADGSPQVAYGDWRPLRGPGGNVLFDEAGVTGNATEITQNAYARLNFGQEFDSGMSVEGNIGLRYIRTEVTSTGASEFVDISAKRRIYG